MITILGAGGAIGGELAKHLAPATSRSVWLAGIRAGRRRDRDDSADLTDLDQTIRAVAGSRVVYLLRA